MIIDMMIEEEHIVRIYIMVRVLKREAMKVITNMKKIDNNHEEMEIMREECPLMITIKEVQSIKYI
jgi:hypothetical protein